MTDFVIEKLEITNDGRHFLTVSFPTATGRRGSARFERGLLVEAHRARVFLTTQGASIPENSSSVLQQLLHQTAKHTVRLVASGGWHGDTFIARSGCVNPGGGEQIDLDPELIFKSAQRAGRAQDYVRELKPFLVDSPYLLLAYVAALAAPLASRLGFSDAFAIALTQESSTGKTLALRLAQSVSMKAQDEQDLVNFGDTTGVLLDHLPAFGGQAISFSDVKNAASNREIADKLRTVAFSATGGHVRNRRGERQREQPQFLIPLLSLENSVAETFRRARIPFEDGEAVRLLDLPVPPRSQGGIFAGSADPTQRALDLDGFLRKSYGVVARPWIRYLASKKELDGTKQYVATVQRDLCESFGELPAHHTRVVGHFGLLLATAYTARRIGALPLEANQVFTAFRYLLRRVLDRVESNNRNTVQTWRTFLHLLNDKQQLPLMIQGRRPHRVARAGFRRANQGGGECVYLSRAHLVATFGEQTLTQIILPLLTSFGCLPPKGEKSVPVAQKGLPRQRYYRLDSVKLEEVKSHLALVLRGFGNS